MTIKVYLHTKCSTCQKADRFLDQHKIAFEQKDIKLTPPSLDELQQMLSFVDQDVKKLFNTSGILYRDLQLSIRLKEMALDEALDLLANNGMLVKRPFVLGANVGLVGFNEKKWLAHLQELKNG